MNVTVYHDDGGNIVAVAARSDDAPPEYMGSRLPLRAVDVQESALTTDLEAAEICKERPGWRLLWKYVFAVFQRLHKSAGTKIAIASVQHF